MGKEPKFKDLVGMCAAQFNEDIFKTLVEMRMDKLRNKVATEGPSGRLVKLEISYGGEMALPLLAEEQVRAKLVMAQSEITGNPISEGWAKLQGRQAVHMKYGSQRRAGRQAHGEASSRHRPPEYASWR